MLTKNNLAIELSRLKGFSSPKLMLEQYSLDSETASLILWTAYLNKDINNKTIADLGAGTGILAKGCLLLGAKKVYLVESDPAAIATAKQNIKSKKAAFLNHDIKAFNEQVDVVIQNPPFGTKHKHADKAFLEKAFSISKKIYSLHKSTSTGFIQALSRAHDFTLKQVIPLSIILKKTYFFHKKEKHQAQVSIYVLEKQKDTFK